MCDRKFTDSDYCEIYNKMKALVEVYEKWNPFSSIIRVGTTRPTGVAGKNECILYIDKKTGCAYLAVDGRPYSLVLDLKGPQGDIGHTGPTGPTGPVGHWDPNNDCDDHQHYWKDRWRHKDEHHHHHHKFEPRTTNELVPHYDHILGSGDDYNHHSRNHQYPNQCHISDNYSNRCHVPDNYSHHHDVHMKMVQGEVSQITPMGLTESIITLTVVPCRRDASLTVSFCGSFVTNTGEPLSESTVGGLVVVTGSTAHNNVSMTLQFSPGHSKWTGSFTRSICLIPNKDNRIYINICLSEIKCMGISLLGMNDYVYAGLKYDF